MGRKISFKILDNELLKESLLGLREDNVGGVVIEHLDEFGEYFEQEGLPVYKNKSDNSEYLNDVIKNNDSFTESIFNTFLCCLLDGYISDNDKKKHKHKRKHFENFYKAIELPTKRLGNSKLKKYNAILERIYEVRPYIKEYELEMDSYWNLLPKRTFTQKITHNKCFKKVSLLLGVLFVLLLVYIGFNTHEINGNLKAQQDKEFESSIDCYFDPKEKKHKILILPFKDINGKDKAEDTGWVLERRFDSLNKADSLGLKIQLCKKLNPTQDDNQYFKDLKTKFGADHVIYGFYDKKSPLRIDGEEKDNIVLNYITDFNIDVFSQVSNSFTDNSYGNFKRAGFTDLNKGFLQENIDFLIYYNAMIMAFNNKKYDKSIIYANKVLKLSNNQNKALIHLYKGMSYARLFKDDNAIIECLLSIKYCSKDKSTINIKSAAHSVVANIYMYSGKDDRARFHFIKSLDFYAEDIAQDLYLVNERLGRHQDNVTFSRVLKGISQKTEQKRKYMIWGAVAKKKAGYLDEYMKDSIKLGTLMKQAPDKSMSEMLVRYKINYRIKSLFEGENWDSRTQRISIGGSINKDSIQKNLCRIKQMYPKNITQYKNYTLLNIKGPFNTTIPNTKTEGCIGDLWKNIFRLDSLYTLNYPFPKGELLMWVKK